MERAIDEPLDYALLLQLHDGDTEAFDRVFEAWHRRLYAIALHFLKSPEDAEDAVQHTFMKLWTGRRHFDYRKGVGRLLTTILKHYVINEFKHHQFVLQKNYELARELREADARRQDESEEDDRRHRLYHLINLLPKQRREVCLMKLCEGLTNEEIADRMHISVLTVKYHYTQAVKTLRSKLLSVLWYLLFFNTTHHYFFLINGLL